MSIKLMSAIFETEFPEYLTNAEGENVKASTAKLVLLALADHANDSGESAYPSYDRLTKKTALSRRTVISVVKTLEFNGLLTISDFPSKRGTNDYTLNTDAYPILRGGEVGALVQLAQGGVQLAQVLVQPGALTSEATSPESSLTIIESSINHTRKSKIPKTFPEPTGDTLGDWLKIEQGFQEKNQPFIDLLGVLSSEFDYNFPKFGESHSLDRVVKMIVKDGRDVKKFISWAKEKKRDPHWYHLKPDTLWGDFPQAFAPEADNSIRARLERERQQNGK